MAEAPASIDGTPASEDEVQVQIELGPHDIYPDDARPAPEPEAAPETESDEVPEPAEDAATPPETSDAGVPVEQPRRSRRERGEEAYQRGLSEGRAAAERERQQKQQQDQLRQQQSQANEQIEQLFRQLRAPSPQERDQAGRQLAAIHEQSLQGNQALEIARQQVLAQMAADFMQVRHLEGATDDDMQQLFRAASMSDFASKVHAIGRRGETELQAKITKLEAELQAARTRAVGARATPEPRNGAGSIGQVGMHDLEGMSLKDIRKLEGTPEYDRMVAQFLADKTAGRI
jgi:hypothetical protein